MWKAIVRTHTHTHTHTHMHDVLLCWAMVSACDGWLRILESKESEGEREGEREGRREREREREKDRERGGEGLQLA